MRHVLAPCVAALALVAGAAAAADKARPSQAQADYQRERAACLRGDTNQSRATCLQEAAAAYSEARRGGLGQASAPDLARNATQRCEAQPPADRQACMQRMVGTGQAQGSVGGGGLLRSSEVPVK